MYIPLHRLGLECNEHPVRVYALTRTRWLSRFGKHHPYPLPAVCVSRPSLSIKAAQGSGPLGLLMNMRPLATRISHHLLILAPSKARKSAECASGEGATLSINPRGGLVEACIRARTRTLSSSPSSTTHSLDSHPQPPSPTPTSTAQSPLQTTQDVLRLHAERR